MKNNFKIYRFKILRYLYTHYLVDGLELSELDILSPKSVQDNNALYSVVISNRLSNDFVRAFQYLWGSGAIKISSTEKTILITQHGEEVQERLDNIQNIRKTNGNI